MCVCINKKTAEVTAVIDELNVNIANYKKDYKRMIAQTEKIRIELEDIQTKVDRSIALIKNLSTERDRWESQSSSFRQQLTTLVGDCLLAAAFITYIGWFDHSYR